jgi:hypothetical protein
MMIPSIILGAATIRRCIMDLQKEGSSWELETAEAASAVYAAGVLYNNIKPVVS